MSDNDLKTNDLDLNDPKDFNGEAPDDINENDSLPDTEDILESCRQNALPTPLPL